MRFADGLHVQLLALLLLCFVLAGFVTSLVLATPAVAHAQEAEGGGGGEPVKERASANPLAPEEAAAFVADWLEPEVSWIPREGPGHGRILTDLITRYQLRGSIVSDAHLAALAIEHGLEVCSNDSDFARFSEVRWVNPVSPDRPASP